MGYIYPAVRLAGKLSQHGLHLHARDTGHATELLAHPEKRSATTYYYWQPAGIFVTPSAMQTRLWVSKSG